MVLELLNNYVNQNGGKIELHFYRLTGEDDETCVVELENEGGMLYFVDDYSDKSLVCKHNSLQLWVDILGDIELGYYYANEEEE
jgi:hypothetical protein